MHTGSTIQERCVILITRNTVSFTSKWYNHSFIYTEYHIIIKSTILHRINIWLQKSVVLNSISTMIGVYIMKH
jgi:hypothetical protein